MEQAMEHGPGSLYFHLIGSRNWTWQNLVSSALHCGLVEENLFKTRRPRSLLQVTLYVLLQTQGGLISVERLFILLTAQIEKTRVNNCSVTPRASRPVEAFSHSPPLRGASARYMEAVLHMVNLKTMFYQCTLEVKDAANLIQKPNSRLIY